MLLLVALIVIVAGLLLAIQLAYIPPLNADTLVKIHNGAISVHKGRLHANSVDHISSVLKQAGVSSGYIAITPGRVFFSRSIPESVHQQLRNVLLNQWR